MRPTLDVEVVAAAAQHPPLAAGQLLSREFRRRRVRSRGLADVDPHAGLLRDQRARQPLEVSVVRRGDDRHGTLCVGMPANRLRDRTYEHEVDSVGVKPSEHGNPLLVEVLEALLRG